MPTAAFVPAEVLMTVYEYLNCAEDLLCASLVNRAWRMASIGLNKIWRRHWQAVKLSATERRRVLAKNADEVDWYAECSAAILRDGAWMRGRFASHVVSLPRNFSRLDCVDGETAVMTLKSTRPDEGSANDEGEGVAVFKLVNKDTFETKLTFPCFTHLPHSFAYATNVSGLGIVICIKAHPDNFYYVTEEANRWIEDPAQTSSPHEPPQLDEYVLLGVQESASEGCVGLYVDGADSTIPELSVHELDAQHHSWVRWGPWDGPFRALDINEDYDEFSSHILTDDYVIITAGDAEYFVHERDGDRHFLLDALDSPCAQYVLDSCQHAEQEFEFDEFVRKLQEFMPAASAATATKGSISAEQLRTLAENAYCSWDATVVGQNFFCTVGGKLCVYPDFAGHLAGRPKRSPMYVEVSGDSLDFKACNNHLVLFTNASFYVIDATQFDHSTPPARLEAVKITRFGIIERPGYLSQSSKKGATASVVASPGAIHEVLMVDHSLWAEAEDGKDGTSRSGRRIENFVRIYNFKY